MCNLGAEQNERAQERTHVNMMYGGLTPPACPPPPLPSSSNHPHIEYSYVTVLDGPDGFVVGGENRQVNRGAKMIIDYV